jgi:hypothetical protein
LVAGFKSGPDDPVAGLPPVDAPLVLRTVYAATMGGAADDWVQLDSELAQERHTAAFVQARRVCSNPITDDS